MVAITHNSTYALVLMAHRCCYAYVWRLFSTKVNLKTKQKKK